MDCSPPGSFLHGVLQARILEWVAVSYSRGSSRPRDQTQIAGIAGRLYHLSHQVHLMLGRKLNDMAVPAVKELEEFHFCPGKLCAQLAIPKIYY